MRRIALSDTVTPPDAGVVRVIKRRDWDRNYLLKVTLEGIPNLSTLGWKDKLSEQEIASVIAYVLSLSSAGPEESSPRLHPPLPFKIIRVSRLDMETRPAVGTDQDLVGDPQQGNRFFTLAMTAMRSCYRIQELGTTPGLI
ncbi:MAG: hypothetical protein U0V70_02180 [Terriglobia bacterium]